MAETRCDPVACTVFPGLLPPLFWTFPCPTSLPLQPPPQPPPQSSQRESCQLGGGLDGAQWGRPPPTGWL